MLLHYPHMCLLLGVSLVIAVTYLGILHSLQVIICQLLWEPMLVAIVASILMLSFTNDSFKDNLPIDMRLVTVKERSA